GNRTGEAAVSLAQKHGDLAAAGLGNCEIGYAVTIEIGGGEGGERAGGHLDICKPAELTRAVIEQRRYRSIGICQRKIDVAIVIQVTGNDACRRMRQRIYMRRAKTAAAIAGEDSELRSECRSNCYFLRAF